MLFTYINCIVHEFFRELEVVTLAAICRKIDATSPLRYFLNHVSLHGHLVIPKPVFKRLKPQIFPSSEVPWSVWGFGLWGWGIHEWRSKWLYIYCDMKENVVFVEATSLILQKHCKLIIVTLFSLLNIL